MNRYPQSSIRTLLIAEAAGTWDRSKYSNFGQGQNMKKEHLVVALTAWFFFLSLLLPAGAALVTDSLMDRLSAGRPGLRSAPGWLSNQADVPLDLIRSTGDSPSAMQDPDRGTSVFPPGGAPFRDPKFSPLVRKVSFTSRDRTFARHESLPEQETHTPSAKARKTAENIPFPGPFFPSPLTESVTLLLLGCGMILLAGFGMKACRKLLSNH